MNDQSNDGLTVICCDVWKTSSHTYSNAPEDVWSTGVSRKASLILFSFSNLPDAANKCYYLLLAAFE